MNAARSILLCLALVSLLAGCDGRRGPAPEWVRSAPEPAVVALSCPVGWAMDRSHLGAALTLHPEAARAVERFLEQTRINPRDPGRITFYLAPPGGPGASGPPEPLVMLCGCANPGHLQAAIADAFPLVAGETGDAPQFSLFDLPPYRFRILVDPEGRVWLGDQTVLARMGRARRRRNRELESAVARVGLQAPFQGFVLPAALLQDGTPGLPGELARSLPDGVAALAWGMTPGPDPSAPVAFELALAGTRGSIRPSGAWLQRLVAALAAMPGTQAPTPDLLQENHRLSMRCLLTQAQADLLLLKLGQAVLPPR
jgi:hypothetical protein